MSARALRRGMWLALAIAVCVACGAVTQRAGGARAGRAPVEVELTSVDGRRFALSELRGSPLLLFVFTTYDDACQIALTEIERLLQSHSGLQALGVAVQPNAEQLLPLYRDALSVSFPLAYDPTSAVLRGESELGAVGAVPAFVMLDAQGRITARHIGALDRAGLAKLVASAR